MIVDLFPFFNELELLELRCEELYGIVDRHYPIESPTTYTGKPKPLFYTENASQFKKYPITPIVLELPLLNPQDRGECWENERYPRDEGFGRAIQDLQGSDWVLLSDMDEIPRGSLVKSHAYEPIVVFLMETFTYWLNYRSSEIWVGTVGMTVDKFRTFGGSGHDAYQSHHRQGVRVSDGGWHFSYQGGLKRIQDKLQAAAHTEYGGSEYTNSVRLVQKMLDGTDLFDRLKDGFYRVPIDETFPRYLREHPERFEKMIYGAA